MKNKLTICAGLFFILITVSCKQAENKDKSLSTDVVNIPASASGAAGDKGALPQFKFNEENHDFGKIAQGEKVSYAFKFKNTGASDLVISSAQGSCGCTVAHYPKEAIAANADAVIDVTFDSDGKSGKVQKTVTLVANTNPNTKILIITAEVIVPEEK